MDSLTKRIIHWMLLFSLKPYMQISVKQLHTRIRLQKHVIVFNIGVKQGYKRQLYLGPVYMEVGDLT